MLVFIITERISYMSDFDILAEFSCTTFQKVTSLNSRLEGASIPSAKKAELKAKISVLQVLLTLDHVEY